MQHVKNKLHKSRRLFPVNFSCRTLRRSTPVREEIYRQLVKDWLFQSLPRAKEYQKKWKNHLCKKRLGGDSRWAYDQQGYHRQLAHGTPKLHSFPLKAKKMKKTEHRSWHSQERSMGDSFKSHSGLKGYKKESSGNHGDMGFVKILVDSTMESAWSVDSRGGLGSSKESQSGEASYMWKICSTRDWYLHGLLYIHNIPSGLALWLRFRDSHGRIEL